jgi:hypothetical protein
MIWCAAAAGHNRADEPAATQRGCIARSPAPTARRLYADQLIGAGILTESQVQAMYGEYPHRPDEGRHCARGPGDDRQQTHRRLSAYSQVDLTEHIDTGVELARALARTAPPSRRGLHAAPARGAGGGQPQEDARRELPLDWGAERWRMPRWSRQLRHTSHRRDSGRGVPSFTATRCCTIRTRTRPGSRCSTWPSRSRACR